MDKIRTTKLKGMLTSQHFWGLILFTTVFLVALTAIQCIKFLASGTYPYDSIFFLAEALGLFLLIFLLVLKSVPKDFIHIILLIFLSAALVYVRLSFSDFKSNDYNVFLNPWINEFKNMSFYNFLKTPVGDYNLPYMYILFAVSKIPVKSLYLIKCVSAIFDIIAAYFAMKISEFINSSVNINLFVYFAVLALPTVVLNSAYWGQCDSIYTAFVLAGTYFAMKNLPNTSMIMFGLSLSFKFQAVIALPILLLFLIQKKLRIRHFFVFAAVYIGVLLPALLAGRPLKETFLVYFNQVQSQSSLTANAATAYTFLDGASFDGFYSSGIVTAIALSMIIFYAAYIKKDQLKNADFIRFLFVFSLFLPYFLPCMHDRYFYLADIAAILYFVSRSRRWYYPLVLFLCSYNDYSRYLFGNEIMDERLGAAIRGAVIVLMVRDYYLSYHEKFNFCREIE